MDILNCPCCDGMAEFVPTVPRARNFVPIGHVACKSCGLRKRANSKGRAVKIWNRRDGKFTLVVNTKPGVSNV